MILKKSLLRGLVKNMSGKKLITPKDFGPKKLNWKNIRPKQILGRKRKQAKNSTKREVSFINEINNMAWQRTDQLAG